MIVIPNLQTEDFSNGYQIKTTSVLVFKSRHS